MEIGEKKSVIILDDLIKPAKRLPVGHIFPVNIDGENMVGFYLCSAPISERGKPLRDALADFTLSFAEYMKKVTKAEDEKESGTIDLVKECFDVNAALLVDAIRQSMLLQYSEAVVAEWINKISDNILKEQQEEIINIISGGVPSYIIESSKIDKKK